MNACVYLKLQIIFTSDLANLKHVYVLAFLMYICLVTIFSLTFDFSGINLLTVQVAVS